VVYLRGFITTLIVRVIVGLNGTSRLFGRHGEDFAAVLNHLPHFADAFGALGLALVAGEDFAGTAGARLDGEGDITLAKAVTVADVQGRRTRCGLIIIRYSTDRCGCKSFAPVRC